jgi:hypothetical protein
MDFEVEGDLQKQEMSNSCESNCEVRGTYQNLRLIMRGMTYEREVRCGIDMLALLLRATQRGFQQGKLTMHCSHGRHS